MVWLLLFAAFIALPVLELVAVLEVGRRLGTALTVLLVFGTGFVGAVMARSQGVMVLRRIAWALEEGRMPADELLHGFFVFTGGVLLMVPGLFTDAVGFALLIPSIRRMAVASLTRWLARKLAQGSVTFYFRGW